MSKAVGANLFAHITGHWTTITTLTRLIRRDGQIYAFADHDRDVVFGGLTYTSVNSFDRSAIVNSAGLSVDNLELAALIDSAQLTDGELQAGLFDFASVLVQEINYEAPEDGAIKFRFGTLGEISLEGKIFRGDLRGLAQGLQQKVGRVYQIRCDADLGDARCGVNIVALTQSGTVATVASRSAFTASGIAGADNLFNGGLVTWTSGANTAFPMEVKRWTSSSATLELFLPMPYNIAAADGFDVYPGCDKNFTTCRDVYGNAVNHRGFYLTPTSDQSAEFPDNPY